MDVGRVEQQQSSKGNWSKSKDKRNKGKWSKGFGKYKGGKQQKGKQQGKSGKGYGDRTQDTKGDFGKPGQGKGKSTFTCHYCGKPGHYAKDCRSRLRAQQVSDVGNAQQQPDSTTANRCTPPASSAASSNSTWTGNQGVRRGRIRTPLVWNPLRSLT